MKVVTILSVGFTMITSLSAWPIISINASEDNLTQNTNSQDKSVNIKFHASETEQEATSEVLGLQDIDLQHKQADINAFYNGLEIEYSEVLRIRKEADKLVTFLKRQKSPVATYDYAYQIINLSEANGTDYKIIVAIMGMESGFCSANYKLYNCFGFLNGVQYSGYKAAFNDIIPKVARMYAKPFGTNFEALATAYGVHNVEYHAPRMRLFYNALV